MKEVNAGAEVFKLSHPESKIPCLYSLATPPIIATKKAQKKYVKTIPNIANKIR